MPRIKVDDAATDGELPARRDLGNAVIAAADEPLENALHLLVGTSLKLNNRGLECAAPWRSMVETLARCDNEMWTALALDLCQQRQPFRRDFRVGQDIFDRSEFRFRKKECGWIPVEQAFIKRFLGMNAGAEYPDRLVDLACDGGNEKCLRRLDDVRKLYWPLGSLDCAKFACDWLARRDCFRKFVADLSFHREPYAKLLQSCSRVSVRRALHALQTF